MKSTKATILAGALVTFLCATAQTARADESGPTQSQATVHERGGLVRLGLTGSIKGGAAIGQPFNQLGSSYAVEFEAGWLLPFMDRDFELFSSARYFAPSIEQATATPDVRLPGDGIMQYRIDRKEVTWTLGVRYRLPLPTDLLRPYASAGASATFARADISASAGGVDFGDARETATRFGAHGALGADLFVGPGAVVAELQLNYAAIDGFVLRNTNAATFNMAIGYRIFL